MLTDTSSTSFIQVYSLPMWRYMHQLIFSRSVENVVFEKINSEFVLLIVHLFSQHRNHLFTSLQNILFWLIWISIWNWVIFLRFIYSSCWFLWTTCASNIPLCNLATQDLASLHSGKVTSAFFLSTPPPLPGNYISLISFKVFLSLCKLYFSHSLKCISGTLHSPSFKFLLMV